jgi:hypothetical protein
MPGRSHRRRLGLWRSNHHLRLLLQRLRRRRRHRLLWRGRNDASTTPARHSSSSSRRSLLLVLLLLDLHPLLHQLQRLSAFPRGLAPVSASRTHGFGRASVCLFDLESVSKSNAISSPRPCTANSHFRSHLNNDVANIKLLKLQLKANNNNTAAKSQRQGTP